jgi:hypothetical protein
MIEALSSSETSVFAITILRNIPNDDILHSHRRKNLKSYLMESVQPRWGPPLKNQFGTRVRRRGLMYDNITRVSH